MLGQPNRAQVSPWAGFKPICLAGLHTTSWANEAQLRQTVVLLGTQSLLVLIEHTAASQESFTVRKQRAAWLKGNGLSLSPNQTTGSQCAVSGKRVRKGGGNTMQVVRIGK